MESRVEGLVASRPEIIDEALMDKASRYHIPLSHPLFSLGLWVLSSTRFFLSARPLGE